MPETAVSEKPPPTESSLQRPFDKMQDFLHKNGKPVFMQLEDTGIDAEALLFRKPDLRPNPLGFLPAIRSGVVMSKIPEGHHIDLIITQRRPGASNTSISPDITIQFIATSDQIEPPQKSQGPKTTSVEGVGILSLKLTGDPQEKRQATLEAADWHNTDLFFNLSRKKWQKHGDKLYWTNSQAEVGRIVYKILLDLYYQNKRSHINIKESLGRLFAKRRKFF